MLRDILKAILNEYVELIELEKAGEKELVIVISFRARQKRELAYKVIKAEAKKIGLRVDG